MKKLSRMLARRSDSPDQKNGRRQHRWTDVDVGSQVVDSHQLPVRVRDHGKTKSSRGGCVEVRSADVCPRCRAVDFPSILSWQPGQARPWVPLSYVYLARPDRPPAEEGVHEPADSKDVDCPYCVFFRRMLEPAHVADGTTKFQPYLRIWRAFERLDGVSEKHELAGSVVLEVRGKNKSLSWGFLVRQADGQGTADYEANDAGQLLGRRVPPLLDMDVPKCWMDYCLRNHECASGRPFAGLKLLDCRNMEVVHVEECVNYIALSHLRDTEDDEPPDIADLPATLKDAVLLTTFFEYRYIWFSSLCAEPDQELDTVFGNAALALILPYPAGEGIPGVSIPRDEQLSLKTDDGTFTTTLVRPDIEVAASPWADQPDMFAQGVAATRRLILTSSQAYFQCREMHCHESVSLPLRLATGISLGRVFDDNATVTVNGIVEESEPVE